MASGTCYHAGGCWPSQEQSGGKLRLGELSKQAGVGSKAHSTTLPRGSLGKEAGERVQLRGEVVTGGRGLSFSVVNKLMVLPS